MSWIVLTVRFASGQDSRGDYISSSVGVKPTLYFRPATDVEAAVKGAQLVWAKGSDDETEEEDTTDGGTGDSGLPGDLGNG